jgi:hypothetical protein
MSELVERPIPAKALIAGLRAVGYSFPTAVADIIDNSISAKATKIQVYSDPLPSTKVPYFCILDNGCGMTYDELDNAMLFGSDRSQKTDSDIELGRFGLGLKTASLSQCTRFTVATKKEGCFNAFAFDLENVERTNKIQLCKLNSDEIDALPCIDVLKTYESGTLVVWNNFDRIEVSTRNFEDSFRDAVAEAKKHVELVYHRFYNDVKIYFNNIRIEERDPFLSNSHGAAQEGRPVTIPGTSIVVIPHTLPYANSLNAEQMRLLGNPKSIYDDQGFFLYRNKRLISWGSWMRMAYRSELNKLARIQVDIPSSMDKEWILDVKKSSAKIPDKLKNRIKIALKDSISKSQRATRFPGIKELSVENKVWDSVIGRDNHVKYQINQDNPILSTLRGCIGKNENRLLDIFISQIEAFFPKQRILKDYAETRIVDNSGEDEEEEVLIQQVEATVDMCDPEMKKVMLMNLLLAEAYQKIAYRRKEIEERILK